MSDAASDAAELLAEIAATSDDGLIEAVRTGAWPLHPLRLRLDTAERRAAARAAIADLARDHGADLWREPGARQRGVAPTAIGARRSEALAQAWQRLGGGRDLLFHLRAELRPAEDRPLSRRHLEAPAIALDPNPGVPAAPYLEHPLSLAEVARFAVALPALRGCSALGAAAARAFDELGQPTTRLHLQAATRRASPERRVVWRLRSAARSAESRLRMATLAARHVIEALEGSTAGIGVPPAAHAGAWGDLETAAIGALAWRRACARDLRVAPPRRPVGHHMHPDAAALGRRYRELADPFAPLLAILRLGCRLHALSPVAATLELQPRP